VHKNEFWFFLSADVQLVLFTVYRFMQFYCCFCFGKAIVLGFLAREHCLFLMLLMRCKIFITDITSKRFFVTPWQNFDCEIFGARIHHGCPKCKHRSSCYFGLCHLGEYALCMLYLYPNLFKIMIHLKQHVVKL